MIALVLALLGVAEPALPEVRYVVRLETAAWEPIALDELRPVVEAKAIGPLSKRGAARYVASPLAELLGGEYGLLIEGRFLEDAEAFSVHLGFTRGKAAEVPSFHVQETVDLGKATRAEQQLRIERAAERASERLAALVVPRLDAARLAQRPPAYLGDEQVVEWDTIEAPRVDKPTRALAKLLDPAEPDHVRHGALSEIESDVTEQRAARSAVERCVLRDPLPDLRLRCVRALAPVARTEVGTQRLLLQAMRTDVDGHVASAIGELSRTFPGLSRKEAIETWLWILSDPASSPEATSWAADNLAGERSVPNLELAVARCLAGDAVIYGKKSACASRLLERIAPEQREAVVWRYLQGVTVFETGGSNVFGDVRRALKEHETPSPALAELYLQIFLDPKRGAASRLVSYPLRKHPAPSKPLMMRVLSVVSDPARSVDAIELVAEWGGTSAELGEAATEALTAAESALPSLSRPHTTSPREALRRALEGLNARAARRAKSKE